MEEAKAKCEEAQRIATLHTIGMASLTNLKGDAPNSIRLFQEALDLADQNASPNEIIGSANLSGSTGFLMEQKTINNGAATLSWQIKPQNTETGTLEVWGSINFVGSAKTINSLKVKSCSTLHTGLKGEDARSWTILRPKE